MAVENKVEFTADEHVRMRLTLQWMYGELQYLLIGTEKLFSLFLLQVSELYFSKNSFNP